MDYQCDVYCYNHVDGYIAVQVAKRRHDLNSNPAGPMPPQVDRKEVGTKAWIERQQKFQEFIGGCDLVEIGLKYDGQDFQFGEYGQAADFLEELREVGYNVPDYAIRILREDEEDE
jgi:hypothetical protein